MNAERDRVRALVREELAKRLAPGGSPEAHNDARHPALLVLRLPQDAGNELDAEVSRPCVIEPDRPCYQSGYCKRLGY
jgi:hypothetical protein